MKQNTLIIFICSSIGLNAQCTLFPLSSESLKQSVSFARNEFYPNTFHTENLEILNFQEINRNQKIENSGSDFIPEIKVPKPPQLTTKSTFLEVCEGNTTTLTAVSDYPIEWYSNYPPEGEPVGRGAVFVTPSLNKGYYIYHAVANNHGFKSNSSDMEVVMVYPLPYISIVNTSSSICSGESATLSAFGTRFYSWNTGETGHEITIRPNHTSTYEVTGINTAGCKRSVSYTQVVENCESTFKFASEDALAESNQQNAPNKSFTTYVYPNPNTGEFHVQLSAITKFTCIEIYSSYGELVYKDKATEEKTTLNLSHVNKGIYTLRILEQNLLLSQQKIVIEP